MEKEKTFYIVYYSNKDKKHITRQGKHDEKSRYGTSKKGVPYYVYYGSSVRDTNYNYSFLGNPSNIIVTPPNKSNTEIT